MSTSLRTAFSVNAPLSSVHSTRGHGPYPVDMGSVYRVPSPSSTSLVVLIIVMITSVSTSRPNTKVKDHPIQELLSGPMDDVWRLGLVVARWSRSTKLLYAGTVNTGMGDRVCGRVNHLGCNQPLRPTQPSTLSMGRKMSTGQSAVTLCGWGVKADMVRYILRES